MNWMDIKRLMITSGKTALQILRIIEEVDNEYRRRVKDLESNNEQEHETEPRKE